MLVVITHHAPVVASVQRVVDVRQVVTGHLTLRINPNLTPKLAVPTLWRYVVGIVDHFSISHEKWYHGWLRTYQAFKASKSCVLTSGLAKLASMEVGAADLVIASVHPNVWRHKA